MFSCCKSTCRQKDSKEEIGEVVFLTDYWDEPSLAGTDVAKELEIVEDLGAKGEKDTQKSPLHTREKLPLHNKLLAQELQELKWETSSPRSPHPLCPMPASRQHEACSVPCCGAIQGLRRVLSSEKSPKRRDAKLAPTLLEVRTPAGKAASKKIPVEQKVLSVLRVQAGHAAKSPSAKSGNSEERSCKEARVPKSQSTHMQSAVTGRWRQTKFTGDMDQLMMDAQMSWSMRRMAKTFDYGNGKTFLAIRQTNDVMEVVTEMPVKAPIVQKFTVGSPEFEETMGTDGKSVLVKAHWDGDVVVLERKKDEKVLPSILRWLDTKSGQLVEEVGTSTGGKVVRYFEKQ